MLRESGSEIAELTGLNVELTREPDSEEWLADNSWFLDHQNQKAMLDGFFGCGRLVEGESLCFFYAKQTPLTDDPRRVLVGAGFLTKVAPLQENEYTVKNNIRS